MGKQAAELRALLTEAFSGWTEPEHIPKQLQQQQFSQLAKILQTLGFAAYLGQTERLLWLGAAQEVFGGPPPQTMAALKELVAPRDALRWQRLHCTKPKGGDHCGQNQITYAVMAPQGEKGEPQEISLIEDLAHDDHGRLCGLIRRPFFVGAQAVGVEKQEMYDNLTGQLLRPSLRNALEQTLAQYQRWKMTGAFMALGIDKLSYVNEAFGMAAGDRVLIAASQALDGCLRNTDMVGRLGDDRFGVLLANINQEQTPPTIERFLGSLRRTSVDLGEVSVHITASAGLAYFPMETGSAQDVIARAEAAMTEAKQKDGRDSFRIYRPSSAQRKNYADALRAGEEVKEAMRDQRFKLVFQPVVSAQDTGIVFWECLLRMEQPDGSMKSAGVFIPLIEQLGMMRSLDREVLRLAMSVLEKDSDLCLAVNISGLTANDRSWLRALKGYVLDRPDLAKRLIIEVTETAALKDIEETARFVAEVRSLGCQVAVDDFGSGFTNFRYLQELAADIVKVDGAFVKDVAKNRCNQAFLRNLVDLAGNMNLSTVAEFVETQEDADFLQDSGVSFLQGYLYGRPQAKPKVCAVQFEEDQMGGEEEITTQH